MVEKTMDKIVALAKSRGFVYPGCCFKAFVLFLAVDHTAFIFFCRSDMKAVF